MVMCGFLTRVRAIEVDYIARAFCLEIVGGCWIGVLD